MDKREVVTDKDRMDAVLSSMRRYADAVRKENRNGWLPSWVLYFEEIDGTLTGGGPLPTDWERDSNGS